MTDPKPRAKDTVVMPARPRGERRTPTRIPFPDPPPAVVTVNGTDFAADLMNASANGAGLRFAADRHPSFEVGMAVTLHVRGAGDDATRSAKVAWLDVFDGELFVGLEFTGGSRDLPCVGLIDAGRLKVDPQLALRVPPTLAVRRLVLPFGAQNGVCHVACGNPADVSALLAVEKAVGMPVKAEPADPEALKRVLDRVYGEGTSTPTGKSRSVDVRGAEAADPVSVGDELLQAALLRQASDIHLDPEPDGVSIRFRVDGELEPYRKLPPAVAVGVLSRFKVLGGMDIAEKRAPQDGGFKHRIGRGTDKVDVRIATIPTRFGERMTVRLLALQTESLTLEKLGFNARDLGTMEHFLARPHGMILLTGPTGSGKSTTLYAAIRRLMAAENLNILTVEDPIEYEMRGVAQVEVDAADKVSFKKVLRSVLRHDPDVVMIGEIRDLETAHIAIQASLTGHLVFSTLHTNSAASVVTRLADMGLERYLIAATLRLVVAQRLVRQLCPRCRSPRPITPREAAALARPGLAGTTGFDAAGCVYCGGKGYVGRLGLFELMALDEEWSRLIAAGAEEAELVKRMRDQQVPTLLDDGVEKVLRGQTAVKDVVSAVTAW